MAAGASAAGSGLRPHAGVGTGTAKTLDKPNRCIYTYCMEQDLDAAVLRGVATSCAHNAARKLSRGLTRAYDQAMKASGLKATQFSILVAILVVGKVRIGSLATRLGLERTTLTRNLALLERDGLVQTAHGSDARERVITVTAKGRSAVVAALPLWRNAQDKAERVLDVQSLIKQSDALREKNT